MADILQLMEYRGAESLAGVLTIPAADAIRERYGMTVIPNIVAGKEVTVNPVLRKITRTRSTDAEYQANTVGASGKLTFNRAQLFPKDVEVRIPYTATDLLGTQAIAVIDPAKRLLNVLTDAPLFAGIYAERIQYAIQEDMVRIALLASTTATIDPNYRQIDGIIQKLKKDPNFTATALPASTLNSGDGRDIMDEIYDNAPYAMKELYENGNVKDQFAYYMDQATFNSFIRSIQTVQSDYSFTTMVDGLVATAYRYNGFRIYILPNIAQYAVESGLFSGITNAANMHICYLAHRQNFAIGLNTSSADAVLEQYYVPKEKTTWTDALWAMDAVCITKDLVSMGYSVD